MRDALASLAASLADRYKVERELGAGGMATVYLAHDLRHDRKVALKVLKPELSAVVGAERFLQEIKLTANLQHPHILPLHDSGQADQHVFYVMPYVEGETLRQRLHRDKQLGVGEALEITKAVASALDYAHRRGVIHRDIKPENILLHDGQAVVADFGIALAVSHAGANRMTETGLSIGTPQYMSPEQAMGERELTARSDVYALGCVLYEMLVGEPPFTGPTAQAIVAKVITEKPPRAAQYRETVPAHVDAAIRKALAKLPADRFVSAQEFLDAVMGRSVAALNSGEQIQAGDARPRPSPRSGRAIAWRTAVPWITSGVLAIAVLALGIAQSRRSDPPAAGRPVRFSVELPPDALINPNQWSAILSPDGSRLVIDAEQADSAQLLLRHLDSLDLEPIAGTDRAGWAGFYPDGRSLGFVQRTKLKRMPVEGGPVTELATTEWQWGAALDGTVYYASAYNSGLLRLRPGRTVPDTLTVPDTGRQELGHWSPRVMPGGKTLLFTNYSLPLPRARIEAISLDDGKRTILVEGAVDARYAGGFLFYVRGDVVYAVRFDPQSLRIVGQEAPVLEDVAGSLSNGVAGYDIADNGTLVYVPATTTTPPRALVWVDRSGREQPVVAERALYNSPSLSPDGKRLAVGIASGADVRNLWVFDLERGVRTRITSHQASTLAPVWSPDGRWLYYTRESPVFDLYRRSSNAASPEEVVLASRVDKHPSSITADGTRLVFMHDDSPHSRIASLDLSSPANLTFLLSGDIGYTHPVLSPDGRWIAYTSDESGRNEVYLRSYPNVDATRYQVSVNGGEQPRWTRGGRELVYREGRRMMAAAVELASGAPARPTALFSGPYLGLGDRNIWYSVTADGERFVMVKAPEDAPRQRVIVVTNWLEEVRARLAR